MAMAQTPITIELKSNIYVLLFLIAIAIPNATFLTFPILIVCQIFQVIVTLVIINVSLTACLPTGRRSDLTVSASHGFPLSA